VARVEAARLGSETIEPEHLLLGFLAEDQRETEMRVSEASGNRANAVKIEYEPDHGRSFLDIQAATELRRTLTESTKVDASKSGATGMPLAKSAKMALSAAQDNAGGSTIDRLHILWGLLRDQDSSVSSLLKSNGVTVEQVEAAIRNRE